MGRGVSKVGGPEPRDWMLVDRADSRSSEPESLHTREVLTAVLRRGLPNLVEATIVPAVLFVAVTATLGSLAAMVVVLTWGYGALARRLAFRQRVPGLLMLATAGLTVRTVIGLASGSTFAYFAQPIGTTVALAVLFAGSALLGRPVIARLAHDFVPLHPDVAARPAIAELFAGLTLLWAGVHVLTAAATFSLLVTLPVTWFVIVKTLATFGISVAAIAVTIAAALRTARREQLTFAPA
jgi:hypothetical protein